MSAAAIVGAVASMRYRPAEAVWRIARWSWLGVRWLLVCVAWKMAALILVVVGFRWTVCDVLASTKSSLVIALSIAAVVEPWKLKPRVVCVL